MIYEGIHKKAVDVSFFHDELLKKQGHKFLK
jgi:hypothetical protein